MQNSRSFRARLAPLLALSFVVLTGCAELDPQWDRKAGADLSARIYVANESSNSVSVINSKSFELIGSIDTLNHATHDLAIARDGKRLYATNLASGSISVIDTTSLETIASIYTGKRCHVVALTNDDRQAWVANITDGVISVIDTTSYRILGTIPVKNAMGIAFSRDGRYAYISSKNKTVSVIDTTSHQLINTIPVGTNPHFLVVGPNGLIWGTNTGENDIFIIDPLTQKLVDSIEVGPAPQQIAFGFKGTAGPLAYVTVAGLNKVVVVNADLKNLKIREQIDVGEKPNGIWANAVKTRVYVAHSKTNDLRIIDNGTSQVIAAVPVGRKPIRVVASR